MSAGQTANIYAKQSGTSLANERCYWNRESSNLTRAEPNCGGNEQWREGLGNSWTRGKELVRRARLEELRELDKHNVLAEVPVKECWEVFGKALVKG